MAAGDTAAAEEAVRMAKAQGSEAFAFAGDRAVQFHGGFFTYECDAQLYLRRALYGVNINLVTLPIVSCWRVVAGPSGIKLKRGPMLMKLYHCKDARSFRALWALEELGLDYELINMEFPPPRLIRVTWT